MSGALAGLVGTGGGAGGGGGTLGALVWGNIYGAQSASNAALTISGITGAHTLQASWGAGLLSYTHNGTTTGAGAAFSVSAGDTLSWTMTNIGRPNISGTVTVTDTTTGLVVDTFNYILAGNFE
jgi:hypothetical protein